jgi:hypothetical protein
MLRVVFVCLLEEADRIFRIRARIFWRDAMNFPIWEENVCASDLGGIGICVDSHFYCVAHRRPIRVSAKSNRIPLRISLCIVVVLVLPAARCYCDAFGQFCLMWFFDGVIVILWGWWCESERLVSLNLGLLRGVFRHPSLVVLSHH